jgi:hypothetical protein
MKQRAIFWLFALVGTGMTVYEWHAVRSANLYSPTAAVFGPWAAIVFGALGLFPSLAGEAGPERQIKRNVQAIVLLLGLSVGLLNWYAMTHL